MIFFAAVGVSFDDQLHSCQLVCERDAAVYEAGYKARREMVHNKKDYI